MFSVAIKLRRSCQSKNLGHAAMQQQRAPEARKMEEVLSTPSTCCTPNWGVNGPQALFSVTDSGEELCQAAHVLPFARCWQRAPRHSAAHW